MENVIYSDLQLRELFHIEFLRALSRKLKAENYAVKGGVNLRLFFKSLRYSEDMDLDVDDIGVGELKELVMKILQAHSFRESFYAFGIKDVIPPDIKAAKQAQTTRCFKVHLITTAGEDLFTKIEFSRRGFMGDVIAEAVPAVILRNYRLSPLIVAHYDVKQNKMSRHPILTYIKKLGKPVFTTFEISALSGKSLSVVTQSLNHLARNGLVLKVCRGVWAEAGNASLNPYAAIPYLFNRQRAYVSFLSALHLYGIIEQIPQAITLASTVHTRTIRTKLGIFSVHRLSPKFFKGFDWYKGEGSFLIAQPEKALVDSLYLSGCKKKQYGYFPELHFSKSFSFKKAREFAKSIPSSNIRLYVLKKLEALVSH